MRYIAAMPSPGREWSTRHSVQAMAHRTVALVNALTTGDPAPAEIARILREHGEADPVTVTDAEVREMRAAARTLREVFEAAHVDRAAPALNALLRQAPGPLRLTSHDGTGPWHPHLDGHDDAPWPEWFLTSSALALTILLWDTQRPPGGVCASSTCQNVFLATGGGPPRRYCSRRCATRERVATHRRTHP
ncbi:CGNR zinc finger domain-containing protein [Actinomadura kijaniata]